MHGDREAESCGTDCLLRLYLPRGSFPALAAIFRQVMYASKGVGLAAPQVGVNKRLMVFNPGKPFFLNLSIHIFTSGCLNPPLVGLVVCVETFAVIDCVLLFVQTGKHIEAHGGLTNKSLLAGATKTRSRRAHNWWRKSILHRAVSLINIDVWGFCKVGGGG